MKAAQLLQLSVLRGFLCIVILLLENALSLAAAVQVPQLCLWNLRFAVYFRESYFKYNGGEFSHKYNIKMSEF